MACGIPKLWNSFENEAENLVMKLANHLTREERLVLVLALVILATGVMVQWLRA